MIRNSIHGEADARFASASDHFDESFADGTEVGASFAVMLEGQPVVDLWGGWADEARTRPWERDTIINLFSTTKTMAALVALLLADRGEIDFDAPVARYWPEFAAAGKGGVRISHIMSHSSGLYGWKETVSLDDLYDWDKMTTLLAAQRPHWEPGTASGYHGLTQGYLIGEVVRRVTGVTLGRFFHDEIAEPLGADFHIGLGEEHDVRVADVIPPPPDTKLGGIEPTPLMEELGLNPPNNPLATRTRAWRAAEIPAAGGHGNARSVAAIQSILANGGYANGKSFLSEAGCRKALEVQVEGTDLVLGIPVRFGLGFAVAGEIIDLPSPNSIFWGGYGGSLVIVDFDRRASIAYAMNRMGTAIMGDPRAMALADRVFEVLPR